MMRLWFRYWPDEIDADVGSGALLYESRLATEPERLRRVYKVPVAELIFFIRRARQTGVEVEHVFDY